MTPTDNLARGVIHSAFTTVLKRRHDALYSDWRRNQIDAVSAFYSRVVDDYGVSVMLICHQWRRAYITRYHAHHSRLCAVGMRTPDELLRWLERDISPQTEAHQMALDEITAQLIDNPYASLIIEGIRIDHENT